MNEQKTSGTGGEIQLRQLLAKLGWEYEPNKKFPPFEVDVYCPEAHAAIEFDGKGWHSFKSRDKRRDAQLLEEYHLPVLRITHFKSGTAEYIDEWLENQTSANMRRQAYERKVF